MCHVLIWSVRIRSEPIVSPVVIPHSHFPVFLLRGKKGRRVTGLGSTIAELIRRRFRGETGRWQLYSQRRPPSGVLSPFQIAWNRRWLVVRMPTLAVILRE